jgi:Fe-S-cluster containining protein
VAEPAEAGQPDCPGYCCAGFYLPYTISELHAKAPTLQDGQQIAEMVIPLTPKQANERLDAVGVAPGRGRPTWKNRGHHFTCKHWDETTMLCTIYAERPEMCRTYPNGRECQHCGLTGGEPQKGVDGG